MTFTYKIARRLAHSRIGLAAGVILTACSGGEPTSPATSAATDELAAVRIAPRNTTIETNQAIQFFGTGVNAAGDSMAISIEWTATGGSISPSGVFSSSTTGDFRVIGRGKGHNKSDTSTVVVVPPQPTLTSITLTPDSAAVPEGKQVSFSATGTLNDGSTASIGVVWTATGGTIDAGGTYTAGMAPGTFRVVATNTSTTVADTVPVAVTAPQLAQIVLTPATVALTPGATNQFTAYGRTSTGDSIATPVSYTATGGTVSAGGAYTAGQTNGTFRVIAVSTSTNLADTSTVTIQPTPLAQLILVPALATVATGGTVQFQVYGRTTAGDSVAAQASFTASGGGIGSAGLYTAGSTTGLFQVIAKQTNGTLADTSAVTITPATTCTSTTTMLCPGDNLQAKATAAGAGATLTLQPGTYRLQTVTPLSNQTFVGQPGAIMSGAKLLTGWTQSGATWYVTGQTQQFSLDTGSCLVGSTCNYTEDVYRDNVLLRRVLSLAAVVPGTFYFDYAADRIYVGDDPTGHTLEGAAVQYAFERSGAGTGVTLDGLVVEKYATPAQNAAIGHGGMPANWIVKNCEVRYNHGAGITGGAFLQVRNCFIHHNGQIGIDVAGEDGGTVEDCEIAYNNTAGYNAAWEAGGVKLNAAAKDWTLRRNRVHHNYGRGLWSDGGSSGTIYNANIVEDNRWEGILHEISYDATITNNTVRRNGFDNPSAYEGAGINLYASGGAGTEVSGNTVENNKQGITVTGADRGSGDEGPHLARNVNVHDNIVTLGPGAKHGAMLYAFDTGMFTTGNNHFEHNTYNLRTADAAPFRWSNSGGIPDTQWRAYGNDETGTFNR